MEKKNFHDKLVFFNQNNEDIVDSKAKDLKNFNEKQDEKKRLIEESKRLKEEKKNLENEKEILRNEKIRLEKENKRQEEEKIKIEEETKKLEEKMIKLEKENKTLEDEKTRLKNEEIKIEEEKERLKEESKRQEDEKKILEDMDKRQKEESKRQENEKIRLENEKIKIEEEKERLKEESKRQEEEKKTLQCEKKRQEDESKRLKKENKILEDERIKLENEKKIIENEKKRQEEESAILKEEKKRQEEEKIRLEEENKKLLEEYKKQEEGNKRLENRKKKIEEESKILENEKKRQEGEKRKKELNKLLKRQNSARNESKKVIEQNEKKEIQNKKLYETLEDMCKLGSIIKNQIIEEKEIKEEKDKKFISIEEAINQGDKIDQTKNDEAVQKEKGLFLLGLLAQNLKEIGITTAIEKNNDNSDDLSKTTLQFLVNGLIDKPKYIFSFEFGEERNNELLNNENEQKIFNAKLKKKLSIEYNIPEDKIIITCPEKGSYKVTVIFMSDEFNNDFSKEKFINSCTQEEFKELCNLKDIQKGVIMDGVKLSLSMLDSRGNQSPNHYGGGKRGGEIYIPPMEWIGYGLRVMDVYDNGNNEWLDYHNKPNEWAVAYHGIGKPNNTEAEKITNLIIKGGDYKNGLFIGSKFGQSRKNDPDIRHPKQLVGEGVYCTPDIKIAEQYAGSSSIVNGKRYKMVFMMRVKPDKIRCSSNNPKEWILDGTTNEMRPYRILLKEIKI